MPTPRTTAERAARRPTSCRSRPATSTRAAWRCARTSRSAAKTPAAGAEADPLVAILGDLIANEHLTESSEFARAAQLRLARLDAGPSRGVKQAPFVVLAGVQMPAALVEIGFLTHPAEERELRSARRRGAIAASARRSRARARPAPRRPARRGAGRRRASRESRGDSGCGVTDAAREICASCACTPNFTEHPLGSVLAEIGRTKVLCTVSEEAGVPRHLQGQGRGWITAEYSMLPGATEERSEREATRGRPSGRTQEIQRLIGRSLRAVADLSALGERTLYVDCDVLQADGGTRCAAITGAYTALALAVGRLRRRGALAREPLRDSVAAVSAGIVGGRAGARSRLRGGRPRGGRHERGRHRTRALRRGAGDGRGRHLRARGSHGAHRRSRSPESQRSRVCKRRRSRPARRGERGRARADRRDLEPRQAARAARAAGRSADRAARARARSRPRASGRGRRLRGERGGQGAARSRAPRAASRWPTTRGSRWPGSAARLALSRRASAGRVSTIRDGCARCWPRSPPRRGAARDARFVCVVALATPQGVVVTRRGECRGRILEAPRGAGGFGYDPIFAASGAQVSFAELPEAEKSRLSHRGAAVRALLPELRRAFRLGNFARLRLAARARARSSRRARPSARRAWGHRDRSCSRGAARAAARAWAGTRRTRRGRPRAARRRRPSPTRGRASRGRSRARAGAARAGSGGSSFPRRRRAR